MQLSYYLSKLIKKIYIPAIKQSNKHKTVKVCSGSHIVNSHINRYTYIGNYCTLINTKVGSFTSIADNCIIGGASHPLNWISTSPVFHSGKNVFKKNFSNHHYNPTKQTIIENDVWIGNNALIKAGVTIQNGAVVGMGAVVTKDIGAYEIWAGNPAKLIGIRFNEETINTLQRDKWWDKEDNEIESDAILFNTPDIYIKKIIDQYNQ